MRQIDADALIADMTNRYCMDCVKRKGMRNGKLKFVYAIGDTPCRACGVGDAIDDIENAPTIDAVEVVRCRDCIHWDNDICRNAGAWSIGTNENHFCAKGIKKNAAD